MKDLPTVTFRKEGVDWNIPEGKRSEMELLVTFRKEGVDWNFMVQTEKAQKEVTFRKEGVDWNKLCRRLPDAVWSHLPQGRCGLK